MTIKVNDTVIINEHADCEYNRHGRVQSIRNGKYWVVNLNMPWQGTISEWFTVDELTECG